MTISLSRITDLVALRLGELAERTHPGSISGAGDLLEHMIELLVENIANALVLAADPMPLETVADCRESLQQSIDWGEEGVVTGELPGDLLRLVSVRLAGWPRGVSDFTLTPGAGLRDSLGNFAPEWMTAQPGRIGAVIMPGVGNGSPLRVRLFPPGNGRVAEALYLPKVYLSNKMLHNWPQRLTPQLVEQLVEQLAAETEL